MKSILTLSIISIFFIVQTLGFVPKGFAQVVTASTMDDIRLELANQIEKSGNKYQLIADTEGESVADAAWRKQAYENLRFTQLKSIETISQMSEDEADHIIQMFQENMTSEGNLNIFSDKAKTSKGKLATLMNLNLTQYIDSQISAIQTIAHEIGYKKVFSKIADQMRSRSFVGDFFTVDNVVIGLIGLIGLIFVVGGFTGMVLSFTYLANFTEFILILFGSMAVCSAGMGMAQFAGMYFGPRFGF